MEVEYLKEEERAELKAFMEMFESAGWKSLLRNIGAQIKGMESNLEVAGNFGEVRYIVGTLDTLRGLRDYEKLILGSFEATIESRREAEFEIDDSFGSQE